MVPPKAENMIIEEFIFVLWKQTVSVYFNLVIM